MQELKSHVLLIMFLKLFCLIIFKFNTDHYVHTKQHIQFTVQIKIVPNDLPIRHL